MPDAAPRLIDWTGERCVPWGGEVQGVYEHLHRYYFAASFAERKRVLDLATGEGYGAAILARSAESVVALEIDTVTVAHNRQTHDLANLDFVEGSMIDLSRFPDGSFDVVVCLEAIEHIIEHRQLLDGIARVLAEHGVVVLSTPDKETYNATLYEPNPFHLLELSRSELLELLGAHFSHVALWTQTGIGGSRLALVDDDRASHSDTVERLVIRRGDDWVEGATSPMFYVAVASRHPLPAAPARSYLVDPQLEALRERDHRVTLGDENLRALQSENSALRSENERLRKRRLTRLLRYVYRRVRARSAS